MRPICTIEAFYRLTESDRPHEAMAGFWQLSRQPEYHACVLAALGRLDEALAVAELCLAPRDRWQMTLDEGNALLAKRAGSSEGNYLVSIASDRLALLAQLERLVRLCGAGDRAGVAALLREWEAQKVRLWKVDDLWEPTPFPVERGAGA